jgi:hypothetical protein
MSQEKVNQLKRVFAREFAATMVALALIALVKAGLVGLVPW